MSLKPGPVPKEFTQLLHDSDMESDEESPDVMNLEITYHMPDDSPVQRPNFERCFNDESGHDKDAARVSELLSVEIDEEGVEWNPETDPLSESEQLDSDSSQSELEPSHQQSSARRCGAAGARLRTGRAGRGRDTKSRRGRSARGRMDTDWSRGQPFVERFSTDEELPQEVRQGLDRLADERERRERAARERRAVLRDSLDEEEEAFEECDDFVWQPLGDWKGKKETFLPERTGPTSVFDTAYDAFRAYWDDEILSNIVLETNRYAEGVESEKFRREWFDTNIDEIMILFAFWVMLSIIKMPTIKCCFSKIPIMRTDIFRQLLRENRYWQLNRAFHLADGSSDPDDPGNVLYPMGPVIDHLNNKFQENYVMDQDVCIDESLTLCKGPLKFVQYIQTKAARLGIKLYELCESKTGYCWSFFVCVGRRSAPVSTISLSASYVMKLIRPILNLGHVLYLDKWFNAPQLARYLKRRGTDCVGTLRSSRKNVPPVIQRAALAEGEYVARRSGDIVVIAVQDRKRVNLISTFHDTAQVTKEAKPGRPEQYRFELVDDYIHGMGGVERLDQMLEAYLVERKQCKSWMKKQFQHLLNMSIQNARILLEQSSGTKVPALAFRMSLVQTIMDRHGDKSRRPVIRLVSNYRLQSDVEVRLTERHFIERIPVSDEMRARTVHKSNLGRSYCVWCRQCGKVSKTVYHCPDCQVALCLDKGCFKLYHTVAEPGSEHKS